MSKTKEYIKNTLILLLGKFTTQFMSFLLIPLYTNKLATDDYGTIDLIHTYIILFVPVLTLRLDSAAFRFLIDGRKDKDQTKKVISNILFVTLVALLITSAIALIIPLFVNIPAYAPAIINILVSMLSGVALQILRGLGKTVHYAIASIVTGISTLVINIALILGLGWGAESILVSSSIANMFCIVYVLFSAKLYKNISFSLIDKQLIKKLLKYSIPLIPHSLSWWIINVSDRTIINIFLGAASNGIYTVSCKLSSVINSVFSIFHMSWQESASLHIDDSDRDEFFTRMINQLLILSASVALVVLVALPLVYNFVIGEQYWSSYIYIPVLLYANIWSIYNGMIGGIYVAKKRTKEIANTTIISAVINLAVDLALIHFIGLHAATISTLVSCLAMAIYRTIDCQKYVKYKMDLKNVIIFTVLFAASTVVYLINQPIPNVINLVVIGAYVLLINKKNIRAIFKTLRTHRPSLHTTNSKKGSHETKNH